MIKLLAYLKRRWKHRKYDAVIQCEFIPYFGYEYVLYRNGEPIFSSKQLDDVIMYSCIRFKGKNVKYFETQGDL